MKTDQQQNTEHHLDNGKRIQHNSMKRNVRCDKLSGKRFSERGNNNFEYARDEKDEANQNSQCATQPVA